MINNDIDEDLEEQLLAVKKAYAARFPIRLKEIEGLWSKAHAENGTDWDALNKMQSLLHGLAGSGSTYGFPVISTVAHKLDVYLRNLQKEKKPLSLQNKNDINQMFKEFEDWQK